MGYKYRERECADCGTVIKGHLPPDKPVRCTECGIKRAIAAAVGMAHKSGAYYDRWQASKGPRGRPRTIHK